MKTVGLRDLKNRLAAYVREVRAGEDLLVTDRGDVVAELRQPGPREAEDLPPGVAMLARRGAITLGRANRADLYPRLRRALSARRTVQLLDAERGDR